MFKVGGGITAAAALARLGLATADARRCKVRRLESLDVPGDGSTVESQTRLVAGRRYLIRASGQISNAAPLPGMDAEYQCDRGNPPQVLDGCQGNGTDIGLGIDDEVNDGSKSPNWGPFSADHNYEVDYVGQGRPIRLKFHDCGYGDNSGALRVRIYGCR